MKVENLHEKLDNSLFVAIDLQTRLMPALHERDSLTKNSNILIEASKALDIPLIYTEQYPKGLGSTDESIIKRDDAQVIEKIDFSIFGCENFTEALEKMNKKTLVLFGAETHVCVYQSALDALNKGYEVYLPADAVSSRKSENKIIGLSRMEKIGVNIETTEMILLQYIRRAGSDIFKKISALIK